MKRRNAKDALYEAMPPGVWVNMEWAYAKMRAVLKNSFGYPGKHFNDLEREGLIESRRHYRNGPAEYRRIPNEKNPAGEGGVCKL